MFVFGVNAFILSEDKQFIKDFLHKPTYTVYHQPGSISVTRGLDLALEGQWLVCYTRPCNSAYMHAYKLNPKYASVRGGTIIITWFLACSKYTT